MLFENSDHVVVKDTDAKGKSLFTKYGFRKDEVIIVITGKVVAYATDYTIPIDHELKIEPRDPGSVAQYLCHSCEPNAGIKNRTLLVALRDLQEGEEILVSYASLGYEYGKEKTLDGTEASELDLTCRCGTKSCTGRLQCYKEMPPEWRAKYRDYISDYLLDDMRYPYIPFS